jgi:hypothetical protein
MNAMRAGLCLTVLALLAIGFGGDSLAAGEPASQPVVRISAWVIASGGGNAASGSSALYTTIGQPVVGSDESDSIRLGHGFLGGGEDQVQFHRIYLPLLVRNAP